MREMIAAFDVHYFGNECALAAAVLFQDYQDAEPTVEYVRIIHGVSQYVSGQFYRRELPAFSGFLSSLTKAPMRW